MTQVVDEYLAIQTIPNNAAVTKSPTGAIIVSVDPKYHNVRLITPIGRFQYIHVDKPFALKQKDGTLGKLQYSATLFMAEKNAQTGEVLVMDLHHAIAAVADAHWPSIQRPDANNPSQLISVKGSDLLRVEAKLGGLHYPLRSGNDMYTRDPTKFGFLRGTWMINTSMQVHTKSGQPQQPICLDERGMDIDPSKFYPGCYGRMDLTCAPFENAGNRGVTFFLNAVQFARHGERMITSNPGERAKSGFAAAGALPPSDPFQEPGFGHNSASTVPPGAAASVPPHQAQPNGGTGGLHGFAPPPNGPIPPNQAPWQPAVGYNAGNRPPGA